MTGAIFQHDFEASDSASAAPELAPGDSVIVRPQSPDRAEFEGEVIAIRREPDVGIVQYVCADVDDAHSPDYWATRDELELVL